MSQLIAGRNCFYKNGIWYGKNANPLNGWHKIFALTTISYCHFSNGILHNEDSFATMFINHSIMPGRYRVSDYAVKFTYALNGEKFAENISQHEWKEMVRMLKMIEIIET